MSKIIRDPAGFAEKTYDLIIIGGGIYGVMLSFEASKRGLKSILLEKADFGRATTCNTLRIIHGGFRYLQHLDFYRFRESVAERRWFLKTFPDFVKPLPFLMPLYGKGLYRPSVLNFALSVNDFLSRRRNHGVSPEGFLPDGRIIGTDDIKDICPSVDSGDLAGGAVWYDAYMLDPERIVMELLEQSCENRASALNKVNAENLLLEGKKVKGVCARDLESDTIHEFRSDVVINAAGPWCRDLADKFDGDIPGLFISSIAWNVLFDKPAISSHAVAVKPPKPDSRTYFLVPWKGRLLAGTGHAPWHNGPEDPIPSDVMLNDFIDDLNLAVPALDISFNDIQHVFSGLLPVKKSGSVDLTRREVIINHETHGGPSGLHSISGIKFTTSRLVAEKALNQIFPEPWQLRMFQKTLKKKLRLKALRKHLGYLSENDRCLLVTCGDNNGAINYYLRELGGHWSYADLEEKSIDEMSALLNDPVLHVNEKHLPFENDHFDRVISIDVHEHLNDPDPFTAELVRVTKPGGRVIVTVPNGDEAKLATRLKNFVGMTKEKYGHVREGFDIPGLKKLMAKNDLLPCSESSFSKFFTEMLELAINFFYVNILSKKDKTSLQKGTIAPATKKQLDSVKKSYFLYSFIYPFFWLISKLDLFLFYTRGYVVIVEGKKV